MTELDTTIKFSSMMLNQIRAIVREEIQVAFASSVKDNVIEDEPPKGRWILDPTGKQDCVFLPGNPLKGAKYPLDLGSFQMKEDDTSTDASLTPKIVKCSALEPFDLDVEGYLSFQTEVICQGKLYKGVLYYVKDVE